MVKQFIWPRDRKNRTFGSGLWDILTGKGPDMYVADWRSPKIDWSEWGRLPQYGPTPTGFPGFYRYDDDWRTPPWIRSKRGYKSYDPKKRKYKTSYPSPDLGVWPPSYGPPAQGLHGGHGEFGPGVFGGFGQHGHGWRLARPRRQTMPRSREEMLHDWRPIHLPHAVAAGGFNPKKWIWGPELPSPWSPNTATTLSSLSPDDMWSIDD